MNSLAAPITLLEMRNLSLKLGCEPTPSMVELLSDTIWGTPGGIRYQHQNTAEKIHDLRDPWFLYLEKDGTTIGVLCLDRRMQGEIPAYYIRYFSFAEGMRRKVTVDDDTQTPASRGQGMFKRFSSQFFSNPAALLEAAGTPKAIFYAFVEMENARSKDMVSQMGLTPCGNFSTTMFSRLFPRKKAGLRKLEAGEQLQMRAQVRSAYAEHAFYQDHGLFYKDEYYVLEREGKIIAGCQAHRVRWRVEEIPGRSGKLLMRMLPWTPLISRLFHPERFHFAAIEGLWVLPGHEAALSDLLEGVLAAQGQHVALLWLSPESPIYRSVRQHVRLGLLQKLRKDAPATVVMRAYGFEEAEVQHLRNRPVYVSAFDGT